MSLALQGIKIACIGPGTTAALQAHAIDVDVTAQHNVAEGLSCKHLRMQIPGKARRFLYLLPKRREI